MCFCIVSNSDLSPDLVPISTSSLNGLPSMPVGPFDFPKSPGFKVSSAWRSSILSNSILCFESGDCREFTIAGSLIS